MLIDSGGCGCVRLATVADVMENCTVATIAVSFRSLSRQLILACDLQLACDSGSASGRFARLVDTVAKFFFPRTFVRKIETERRRSVAGGERSVSAPFKKAEA